MNKYIIEGGLDFYEELYKSLDIEETNEKTEEDKNLCLISNQLLTENYVQLNCGHKFNYIPLFLDLKNHKQKFNGMEGSSSKLAIDEIRCPYCRTKQKGVLPYYEELGFAKTNGVNDINPYTSSKSYSYKTGASSYKTCEFISLNTEYDPSGNNPTDFNSNNSGNCKFIKCFHTGSQLLYSYEDEKHYCWQHKKEMIKKYKKEIKDKEKAQAKKAKDEEKQKAKDEEKKTKDEAKEKAKKEKEEAKKLLKTKPTETENVVIGETNIIDLTVDTGCVQILKTGQNKGTQCGCKVMMDNLCNRHFKIKHGIITNNI